ncbi:MAG: RIO1 family regulatory kinase/ATPase [Thermomicrobiales bacterium]
MSSEIPESLFEDGWLNEVEHVVSSGKEGTVYCCSSSHRIDREFVAVKIYKPRAFRSFKNDAIYTQGRAVGVSVNRFTGVAKPSGAPDRRLERAIRGGSRIGRIASESSWTHHEFSTLTSLHRIGARVPRPYTSTNTAIVMDYVGEPDAPAPKLKDVSFPADQARAVFRMLIDEIELWLSFERIHGDLSPFNILYWNNKITVIDFPQAVSPYENPMAFSLLLRDIENVCRHFPQVADARDPLNIASVLWARVVQIPH